MLKKIKSIYFSIKIFTFIADKRKLNLIKNNKSLQKTLKISLFHYRLLSEKFIINQANDICKIYNVCDDFLVFEGNYINGNGKEYYDDGKLFFEGKYLNRKRFGNGKIYGRNGNIITEGVYKNGLRNGQCIEYYSDGKVLTKGEFLNDNEWNTKEYDKNGKIKKEIKNGKGILNEYNENYQLIFEGEYLNGLKNGKGKKYSDGKLIFEGEYLNGLRYGKGKEFYYNNKIQFEGEYLCNRRWNVKEYDINGNIICELKNGKGFMKEFNHDNKLIYEGEYLYGLRNGKGKQYYENGVFEGEFLNGKKNGKGKVIYNDSNLIFEGEFLYDHKYEGKEYYKGILKYEGKYLHDKKFHGKGYDDKGNIIYELINGAGKRI